MFLKNAWYVAGWDNELVGEGLLARRLLGIDVVFYRGENGRPVALQDRCCHRLAPLSHGQREGNCLRCMYHGLLFDATGRCVEVPGQERISPKLRVRGFPVVERDHLLWIWMGDPTLADPNQIQDSHWHDSEGWTAERGGYIHYESNVHLITDNLLDFSHLAFVHSKSIGTRKQGGVKPEVDFFEESVRVRFTTLDGAPPPFARKLSMLPDVVDRFNFYVWNIRGYYFAQDSVIAPAGDGYGSSSPLAMKLHTFIALTPEDETSTHYFWSTAHNDFSSGVPDVTRQLTVQVASAFEEDRQIIEAQQRSIDVSPDAQMIAIAADGTLMRIRRTHDAMESAERSASVEQVIAFKATADA
jgi:phenylpropionate dioxygenase-like ring-hydroxylating dioxygenase large terminal subunit